jgi:Fic family protein
MSHYIWQLESWPVFFWAAQEIEAPLGKARFLQGRLLGQVHALGFAATDEVRQRFLVTEAIQTSAIEGVQLDQDAVRSSVARRLGLPTAGLTPATPQTESLVDLLFDATNKYDEPLSPDRLKRWQAALFPIGYSGLKKIMVGDWRKKTLHVVSGPIGKEREHFAAPPPERLETEMARFFSWFGKSSRKVDGLLRAGLAHLYFVTIHPFEDGNGRIARAITDMALAQDEKLVNRFYSLSGQIMNERDDYYAILEKTQRGNGDVTEWLSWYLSCFQRALERSENLLENVAIKSRFWQRVGNIPLSEHQRKVVNRLLDAGPGGFKGGLTTRKFAGLAHVSRATAYREISDLLTKGILRQNPGGGRSSSYDLDWERK